MRRDTENWLASADYDIETASHMFATGRFLYVVFMCHLAVEKTLKAIAAEAQGRMPPRTHDLLYLITLGSLKLSQDYLDFIGKLNNASIPTRYPEDLAKTVGSYPKKVAQEYLKKTKEVIEWLKRDPRLKRS